MVSCLESVSREERHEEIIRNDYQRDNEYNETHEDARAGGKLGRGTGGGHTHWLPNCTGALGVFNYSNFDTNPASEAGTDVDNETRTLAMVRSLYKPTRMYSENLVDTSLNVREGQYRVP